MTYALATDGFLGDDYGPCTRGWIELERGGRVSVPAVVAPPAFVRVVEVRASDAVAAVTARASRTVAPPPSSPPASLSPPTVTVAPSATTASVVLIPTVVADDD
jgi:hypothetical protein